MEGGEDERVGMRGGERREEEMRTGWVVERGKEGRMRGGVEEGRSGGVEEEGKVEVRREEERTDERRRGG